MSHIRPGDPRRPMGLPGALSLKAFQNQIGCLRC